MMAPREKLIYGTGAFGYGSVNQMLGNYLMFFGTGVLGLSGTLMGLALGLSTVWDAITDPVVGTLSDRLRTRFGRRHLLMAVGCVMVAVLNLLLWRIDPAWGELSKFGALLGGLLLMETFNTVYSTPYSALGFDMAQTYHERTSIQGYKTAFQSASLMIPSLLMMFVLAPQDYVTINSTAHGYQVIATITSALCVAGGFFTIWGTRRYRTSATPQPGNSPKSSVWTAFRQIFQNKNNIYLISAYAVALSCSAFLNTLGMHLFTYTFHFTSGQVSVVMACLVLGIIGSQPLWCLVSARLGKRDTVLVALSVVLIGAVVFSLVLAWRLAFSGVVRLVLVAGVILWLSAGVGCIYSLPISMFADNINPENTALATGFLTFCTKFTNAMVTLLVGVILDVIGFRGGVAVQSLFVCTALGWALIWGVVVASLVAWWLFSKYRDSGARNCAMLKE